VPIELDRGCHALREPQRTIDVERVPVRAVAGFGAVFLQLPGIVLALILLGVVAGTCRRRSDLVRVGGYLMGVGLVGWSLVGPAVKGGGGFLFLNGWVLVTGYAAVAVAGCLLVAGVAVVELRRRDSAR